MTVLSLRPQAIPGRRERVRKATQRKADELLQTAAALMAEKGFEATAIRDVGRKLDASLAGMYYYFKSKEELLYQIQYRTFASLLQAQQQIAERPGTPKDRLRRLLIGHLTFFTSHPNEMKICTYELESLTGEYYNTVLELRRRYYRLMADLVAQLMTGPARKARASAHSRRVTLFVFGMLNWAFTWYSQAKDGTAEKLGGEMFDLVINGIGLEPLNR